MAEVNIPGFNTPAVGFEQPFEMLQACHERVQRSLALLARLIEHIDRHGHGADTQSAAGDVLRYFDIAGPHHHEDEERHVFPALRGHAEPRVREAVAQLQADHVHMHALWARLRAVLLTWQDAAGAPAVSDADRALARAFAQAYEGHIALEETLVYPAAQPLFDPARLREIGDEMARRRRSDVR